MKKIKSLFLPFVTILVVMTSGAGCKKSGTKSSEAAITAFSFEKLTPVATGTISGGNISITVPGGTDVKSFIATFALSNGATAKVGDVLQVSGTTPNNFTSQVEYIVTAQDGITTNKFTVTVNIQTENSKEITGFSFKGFEGVMATITDTAITVALPAGTPVTALIANFSTTGASVKIGDVPQVSGTTPNDFTTPKTYTVTAQDNSTHNYTVTVTGPATTKEITAFSFEGLGFLALGTIDETNHTIAVGVKTSVDITKLVATFTTTGVSVKAAGNQQTSGITVNNFASPVTYTVTAQDGTTKDYIVTVTATATKYVTIPDANFLAYLKTTVPSAFDGTGDNADKLNVYDDSVTLRTNINATGYTNIVDLTGIEYFVGLTYLNMYGNSVESLDVSKNTALTSLYLSGNNLSSLDLSQNIALTSFVCSNNKLNTLDVSRNTALTSLYCNNNQLTSLDLSRNTALTRLDCSNNKLNTLDISSQTSWNTLTIYSDPVGADENPFTTLKVNVAQKDNAEVKEVKTNNPLCVISTYTTSSIVGDVTCHDYEPNAGTCTP